MTNRLSKYLRLAAATLLFGVFSSAALADTGSLVVSVVDSSGNPVAGASVTARTPDSLTSRSGETGADGEVRLMGLDPSENYVITVSAEGYQAARNEGVLVITERTLSVPVALVGAGESIEEIVTYGRSQVGQLVDTTSAMQSTDVTLDFIESLPTGRSYQSYLQMAPTTKPTNVEGGNPSSKSGVNYSDVVDSRGNTAGSSSDNVYYIDGVNITDNYYGTFGANFNSEIIQEQQIITGGVPAEYEGGQGLISRVVSKSGGNEFHGSVNYYMQSDSLVADNKHLTDASFSTYDTAFTLGGPIIKDKLWFFTSYQQKEKEEDVIDPNTQQALRTVTRTNDYGFAKVTWQPTEDDKLTVQWFNDPGELDGSTSTTTLQNRDRGLEYGGTNSKIEYSHAWNNFVATGAYIRHESNDDRIAADNSTRNDVATQNPNATNVDTDLGGYGSNTLWQKAKESYNFTLEYFADTDWGSHEIKFGFSDMTNESYINTAYTGDGAQYNSIDDFGWTTPITLDDYAEGSWTGEIGIATDDYGRIADAMEASSNAASYIAMLDANANGTIDNDEVGALVMGSTTGNPDGMINAYRIYQSQQGPTNFETRGQSWFIQDSWNIDEHWTLDVGIRAEKWDHYASDAATKIFTFDWEYAPRVSLIYDINADGASKIWGFYGRYYDPIRTNMTRFAGTVTGSIRDEQIYTGTEWLTFRTRGGPQAPDGFFAPSTKTPYTDEIMIGWEHSLTPNQSVSVTYTDRETNDILEDYAMYLYATEENGPGVPVADRYNADGCGVFCLPYSYFGFTEAPEANYFIATLAGGVREYQGLEVTWRKRRSSDSKWFGLASYSWNDAKGNTNSDSNADFQGDVLWLDPRSPNQYGKQPGNITHMLKAAGSYMFDNGLEVGATWTWNSGLRYSRTWSIYGRHLPERVDTAYEYGGVTTRWLAPDAVGGYEADSWNTLNARVKYTYEFDNNMTAEFFLDVFNVLDDQAPIRFQDLDAGDGVYDFGQANDWLLPRRFYLGARLSF